MPRSSTIYVICSDRHRNGKTLLARVLVDFLLLEERDPFVIDAGFPEGPLRAAFPGRTALIDFKSVQGQMKLFDTILASPGRDYVIEMTAGHFEDFFVTSQKLDFFTEAQRLGFSFVIFYVVDKDITSFHMLNDLRDAVMPTPVIGVTNRYVGSSLKGDNNLLQLDIPSLEREAVLLIEDKRFSMRNFMLGEVSEVPFRYRNQIRSFFEDLLDRLSDLQSSISLQRLKE